MSHPKNKPPVVIEEHQSSFSTGFFLGVIGGAIGMYLLNSEKGGDLLEYLKKELGPYWDEAQQIPEVKEVIDKVQSTRTLIAKEAAEVREVAAEFSKPEAANESGHTKFPKFKKHA